MVQRALETVLADRTALVIAHRLSTVEIADRVLVLEHGRIVEDGPPDELIRPATAVTRRCIRRGSTRWPDGCPWHSPAKRRRRVDPVPMATNTELYRSARDQLVDLIGDYRQGRRDLRMAPADRRVQLGHRLVRRDRARTTTAPRCGSSRRTARAEGDVRADGRPVRPGGDLARAAGRRQGRPGHPDARQPGRAVGVDARRCQAGRGHHADDRCARPRRPGRPHRARRRTIRHRERRRHAEVRRRRGRLRAHRGRRSGRRMAPLRRRVRRRRPPVRSPRAPTSTTRC